MIENLFDGIFDVIIDGTFDALFSTSTKKRKFREEMFDWKQFSKVDYLTMRQNLRFSVQSPLPVTQEAYRIGGSLYYHHHGKHLKVCCIYQLCRKDGTKANMSLQVLYPSPIWDSGQYLLLNSLPKRRTAFHEADNLSLNRVEQEFMRHLMGEFSYRTFQKLLEKAFCQEVPEIVRQVERL